MAYQCPLCARAISTTEYWHQCDPMPKPRRESIIHKMMMATVARHKKQAAELELDLARAAWSVLLKLQPQPGDPARKRAYRYLNDLSTKARDTAFNEIYADKQPIPGRRWQDNRPVTRSTHNP